jgi:hypothetical protein
MNNFSKVRQNEIFFFFFLVEMTKVLWYQSFSLSFFLIFSPFPLPYTISIAGTNPIAKYIFWFLLLKKSTIYLFIYLFEIFNKRNQKIYIYIYIILFYFIFSILFPPLHVNDLQQHSISFSCFEVIQLDEPQFLKPLTYF